MQAIAPRLPEETMSESRPTVICAWCGTTIEAGAKAISHGLCDSCAPEVVRGLLSGARSLRRGPKERFRP